MQVVILALNMGSARSSLCSFEFRTCASPISEYVLNPVEYSRFFLRLHCFTNTDLGRAKNLNIQMSLVLWENTERGRNSVLRFVTFYPKIFLQSLVFHPEVLSILEILFLMEWENSFFCSLTFEHLKR